MCPENVCEQNGGERVSGVRHELHARKRQTTRRFNSVLGAAESILLLRRRTDTRTVLHGVRA